MDVYGDKFPFETNLNFSRRLIRLSILGCLGDPDNASKWLHEKSYLIFFNISHLLFVKHRHCIRKFNSFDICNYFKLKKPIEIEFSKKEI